MTGQDSPGDRLITPDGEVPDLGDAFFADATRSRPREVPPAGAADLRPSADSRDAAPTDGSAR